jgi:hypothetical protein
MAMMPPGDDPERKKPPRRPSETTYADAPLQSGEPGRVPIEELNEDSDLNYS